MTSSGNQEVPCDESPRYEHQIKVTVSFDRHITLGFPHRIWASSFESFFQSTEYYRNMETNCYVKHDHSVVMGIPSGLNSVEFKSADRGLVFVFTDTSSAAGWVQNTGGLWKLSTDNGVKASTVQKWTHAEMDSTLKLWRSAVQSTNQYNDAAPALAKVAPATSEPRLRTKGSIIE